MNYLVGIPCLYGYAHTKEAIDSAKNSGTVLCVDNGADEDVKKLFNDPDILKIRNEENIYVNPAWNQIIEYFLWSHEYDVLCIMNSDLILPPKWNEALDEFYTTNDHVPIPETVSDKMAIKPCEFTTQRLQDVNGGTAGIFICLTRKQAEIIFPIPEYIKVWFGDNWIYEILRGLGYKTLIYSNLEVYHAISQNVSIVPGISEIIEEDKSQWNQHSLKDKESRIKLHSNQ